KVPMKDDISKLVLIVDDIEDVADLIAIEIEMRGCKTVTARTGEEAVELAAQVHPQLVLMDLSMPGMDGYEATRRILSNPETRQTCVIAISAYLQRDCRQKALRAGCAECLEKPLDFDKLHETMSRLIGYC